MISVTKVLFFAVIASAQDAGADRKLRAPRDLESNETLAASLMEEMRQLEDSVVANMRQLERDGEAARSLRCCGKCKCPRQLEEKQRELDERVMANVTSVMASMRQLMDASETRVRQLMLGRDGDVDRSLDILP